MILHSISYGRCVRLHSIHTQCNHCQPQSRYLAEAHGVTSELTCKVCIMYGATCRLLNDSQAKVAQLFVTTLMDPTTGSLLSRGLKEMRSFPESVRCLTPTRIETNRATTRPNTSTGSPLWDRNLGSGYTTS